MHWAGGGEMCDKFTHPLIISEDVQKFLNEITKTKDFTNAKTNAERKIG